MAREVVLSASDLVGKKIYYDDHEVGYIANVKNNEVTCAIDSDIVAHRIKSSKTALSLEVIDR